MRGKGRQGDVKSWLEVTVQALEAEGFELQGHPYLSVARSSWWTQKGTPYGEYLITKASSQLT